MEAAEECGRSVAIANRRVLRDHDHGAESTRSMSRDPVALLSLGLPGFFISIAGCGDTMLVNGELNGSH